MKGENHEVFLPCERLKVGPGSLWLFAAFAKALAIKTEDILLKT